MEKKLLISELNKISKTLFDKKEFIKAGRINLAIDVIQEEELPQNKHSNIPDSGNNTTNSKQMDDYEFNLHRKWKDEPKQDGDDFGGAIKHFQ